VCVGRVVPFREELLAPVVDLCAAGVRRTAGQVGSLLRLPSGPVEPLVEALLRQHLSEPNRVGWAVVDGGRHVHACAAAAELRLTPDDPRYTYLPPHLLSVGPLVTHASSDAAAAECYPLLLAEIRRHAVRLGRPHLQVQNPAGNQVATGVWRRLGLRLELVMAVRRLAGWSPSATPPAGVTVRRAEPADLDGLTDLALELHRYHAEHASIGVSADQPRETNHRVAAGNLAASDDTTRQLAAEDGAGRLVGTITASIRRLGDDDLQRYLYPARYGYIGLTSVTAAARGTGVGRALVDAVMTWFRASGLDAVMLIYAHDNPLAARFWTRAGFTPHLEIYAESPAMVAGGSSAAFRMLWKVSM
jgi:ribosomal protein S18 acetylase RimI-like enzyme